MKKKEPNNKVLLIVIALSKRPQLFISSRNSGECGGSQVAIETAIYLWLGIIITWPLAFQDRIENYTWNNSSCVN